MGEEKVEVTGDEKEENVKIDADMENHVTEEEITSKDLDDDSSESTGGDEDSATDDTKDTTEGDVEPSE